MDLILFALVIWVIGFLITLGMVYEIVKSNDMQGKFTSWIKLILFTFFTWPIGLGGMIIANKGKR